VVPPKLTRLCTRKLPDKNAPLFDSQSFGMVIFGFCFYLCDREKVFCLASEADRLSNVPGWLMILDYYTLLTWHPDYERMTCKIWSYREAPYTDAQKAWVAVSVLRNQRALNA